MAHGMLWDLPGETVTVWTVIVKAAALRKYTEQIIALCFFYIFFIVFVGHCRYSTPRLFPDDCVSVFDKVACEYIVHKKDNPIILCPIYAAVGK